VTDPRGFLQLRRRVQPYRPVDERLRDYAEQLPQAAEGLVREQAQRCWTAACRSATPAARSAT
jgi:hypothetical protein